MVFLYSCTALNNLKWRFPARAVYHTIRWTSTAKSKFAPAGRNAEDLGVEVFSPNAAFSLTARARPGR
jgi:hypothetical protein